MMHFSLLEFDLLQKSYNDYVEEAQLPKQQESSGFELNR
jgi:hypothetical protein